MPASTLPRREVRLLIGIFCAALLGHFYLTTTNWTTPFMPGHEFRQAQTAIVSHYIDEQNNFSLLYETPILGKPWVSILLEVPFYEWSVVWLSRATGLPHFMAARTITLTCFYLTLPALYLLLGRLAVARPRRLLVLSLILTSPVYIFYSRAFLMESMELMCCAWFLLAFVRTMDERRWSWLTVAVLSGLGAALVKSSTLAVWLLPAASYGAWQLWRDLRAREGWRAVLQTFCWGIATVAPALLALRWWINLTDPIKAAHASAWIFTSKNLSQGNWGLLDFTARFSPKVWSVLLNRWQEALMAPWIVGLGLVASLFFFPRERGRVLGLAAVFFLAQLMFPFAYAYQDYYYYACAVFVLGALGLGLQGLLDSRVPRWACGVLIGLLFTAQLETYWTGYRVAQVLKSDGGFDYTVALSEVAPKNSVFIIAGADWAAIIPLYSKHKALMVRSGLEYDDAYLKRAFNDLAGEDVCALIVVGEVRHNRHFIELVADTFDMDSSIPTFSQGATDVYFSRPYVEGVHTQLRSSLRYPLVTFSTNPQEKTSGDAPFNITPGLARSSFGNVSPAPFRARFAYGLNHAEADGDTVLSAHPDSDVWLRAPAGATEIRWDFGLFPNAYEREGDKTDGVEFVVVGETSDGGHREIYRRVLDPAKEKADRGRQHAVIPYAPLPGETLIFSDRPRSSYSYDWSYWARIEVR